jgi:hypothetical protein
MGGPWEKTRTAITEEPQEDFPIPEGARKVVSVEIDYPILVRYDKDNKDWVKETHTLKWGEQETTSSCFWPQPSTTTGTAPGARKGERP